MVTIKMKLHLIDFINDFEAAKIHQIVHSTPIFKRDYGNTIYQISGNG